MRAHGGHRAKAPAPVQQPQTNYSELIQQDPAFMALKQQISAQQIADAAQRAAATQQALIQYGYVPDFSHLSGIGLTPAQIQMLQQDVTPQVAALAHRNTASGLSAMARMQHDEDNAMRSLRNNLAARGALSSGDDAYRTNEQQRAYNLAQNDALQRLLATINGYQQSYLTNQQNEQSQLLSGLQSAQANQAALLPYTGAGTAAPSSPQAPQINVPHTNPAAATGYVGHFPYGNQPSAIQDFVSHFH